MTYSPSMKMLDWRFMLLPLMWPRSPLPTSRILLYKVSPNDLGPHQEEGLEDRTEEMRGVGNPQAHPEVCVILGVGHKGHRPGGVQGFGVSNHRPVVEGKRQGCCQLGRAISHLSTPPSHPLPPQTHHSPPSSKCILGVQTCSSSLRSCSLTSFLLPAQIRASPPPKRPPHRES